MKLSKRTLEVLKNFSSINPSLTVRAGSVLKTISPSKKVLAVAQVEEDFGRDFSVYQLTKLLGTVSLLSDPEIELGENQLTISSEGRRVDFTYAAPETVISPPDKNLPFSEIAEFPLPARALSEVTKAAGILGLPYYRLDGDGSRVVIEAVDPSNPSSDKFSIDLGETDAQFQLRFRSETFKFMPGDYVVAVSQNIGRFTMDGLTYFVVSEAQKNG